MNTFFCHFSLCLSVCLSTSFKFLSLSLLGGGKKSRACPVNFPSDSNYCRGGGEEEEEKEEEESNDSSLVDRVWLAKHTKEGGVEWGSGG